ncbi:hypothetical protein KL909_001577 [Ogataea angusta]|nr:hypothetical protein KL909_001577 [Ogataea angusta]
MSQQRAVVPPHVVVCGDLRQLQQRPGPARVRVVVDQLRICHQKNVVVRVRAGEAAHERVEPDVDPGEPVEEEQPEPKHYQHACGGGLWRPERHEGRYSDPRDNAGVCGAAIGLQPARHRPRGAAETGVDQPHEKARRVRRVPLRRRAARPAVDHGAAHPGGLQSQGRHPEGHLAPGVAGKHDSRGGRRKALDSPDKWHDFASGPADGPAQRGPARGAQFGPRRPARARGALLLLFRVRQDRCCGRRPERGRAIHQKDGRLCSQRRRSGRPGVFCRVSRDRGVRVRPPQRLRPVQQRAIRRAARRHRIPVFPAQLCFRRRVAADVSVDGVRVDKPRQTACRAGQQEQRARQDPVRAAHGRRAHHRRGRRADRRARQLPADHRLCSERVAAAPCGGAAVSAARAAAQPRRVPQLARHI